jgi:hypothetical protein
MSLGAAQREFAMDVARLINYINERGYECTFGDAYRSPKAHGDMGEQGPYGRARSAHKQRLAIDLNLFKDGKYLTETEDHRLFGEFWERLRPEHRWGGNWNDGNHYSRSFNGIA